MTEALLRDLDQVPSTTRLAVEATQDESACPLEVPERLSDYIRQVQE